MEKKPVLKNPVYWVIGILAVCWLVLVLTTRGVLINTSKKEVVTSRYPVQQTKTFLTCTYFTGFGTVTYDNEYRKVCKRITTLY